MMDALETPSEVTAIPNGERLNRVLVACGTEAEIELRQAVEDE